MGWGNSHVMSSGFVVTVYCIVALLVSTVVADGPQCSTRVPYGTLLARYYGFDLSHLHEAGDINATFGDSTVFVNFCGSTNAGCPEGTSVCLCKDGSECQSIGDTSLQTLQAIEYGNISKAIVVNYDDGGFYQTRIVISCDPSLDVGYFYDHSFYGGDYSLYMYSSAGCGAEVFSAWEIACIVLLCYFGFIAVLVVFLSIHLRLQQSVSARLYRAHIMYEFPKRSVLGWFFLIFAPAVSLFLFFLFAPDDDMWLVGFIIMGIFCGCTYISGIIFTLCSKEFHVFGFFFKSVPSQPLDSERYLWLMRSLPIDLHFDIKASHAGGNESSRYVSVPYWADLTLPFAIPSGSRVVQLSCSLLVYWCHDSTAVIEKLRTQLLQDNSRLGRVDVTTVVEIPCMKQTVLVPVPGKNVCALDFILTNRKFGLLLLVLGLSGVRALCLALMYPTMTHKIVRKASLVGPVVDNSFLQTYKLPVTKTAPPSRLEFHDRFQKNSPMFLNPMPLSVPLRQAIKVEGSGVVPDDLAPPITYMCGRASAPPRELEFIACDDETAEHSSSSATTSTATTTKVDDPSAPLLGRK